jgi:uncharacterized protein with ParB-like and HNH nuclease domain
LIDSIFTGAAIPALVFAVTMDADGQEHRNVIDGKQRLTTIKRFMDGEVRNMTFFKAELILINKFDHSSLVRQPTNTLTTRS